jgi:hypothetical protein
VSDLGELPWRIRSVRARDTVGVEQIPGERKLHAVDGEVAVERRRPPEVVQPRGVAARLRPQGLARMEAAALLDALAAQVGAFELTGDPVRGRNPVVRGYESVPLRVVPGQRASR